MSASSTSAIELAQHLAQQFAARADEADRLGKLPNEDVQALKDSGYLGLSVMLLRIQNLSGKRFDNISPA